MNKTKLKIGQVLRWKSKSNEYAVYVGALAVFVGYHKINGKTYIHVVWLGNNMNGKQCDGGYARKDFELITKRQFFSTLKKSGHIWNQIKDKSKKDIIDHLVINLNRRISNLRSCVTCNDMQDIKELKFIKLQ